MQFLSCDVIFILEKIYCQNQLQPRAKCISDENKNCHTKISMWEPQTPLLPRNFTIVEAAQMSGREIFCQNCLFTLFLRTFLPLFHQLNEKQSNTSRIGCLLNAQNPSKSTKFVCHPHSNYFHTYFCPYFAEIFKNMGLH